MELRCANCPSREKTAFRLLDGSQVDALCAIKRHGLIKKGEDLFTEGQRVRGIYCVQDGHFKLTRHSASGRETIVRFASVADKVARRGKAYDGLGGRLYRLPGAAGLGTD